MNQTELVSFQRDLEQRRLPRDEVLAILEELRARSLQGEHNRCKWVHGLASCRAAC
jgi:hypothetical protein